LDYHVDDTSYGGINIQRGIFQGDILSPLLFIVVLILFSLLLRSSGKGYQLTKDYTVNNLLYMDGIKLYGRNDAEFTSLVAVVDVFAKDICMAFGLNKCNCVSLRRSKLVESEDIPLPSGDVIRQLPPNKLYQY